MSDWNKWRPAFVAVAKTHDCMDVLNPDYVPQPGNSPEAVEERALFQEKQIYMFLVMTLLHSFENTMLTTTLKLFGVSSSRTHAILPKLSSKPNV